MISYISCCQKNKLNNGIKLNSISALFYVILQRFFVSL